MTIDDDYNALNQALRLQDMISKGKYAKMHPAQISKEEFEQAMERVAEGASINSRNEGLKFDEDKESFALIAPEFLYDLARVLTYGAKKYAPRNWERGLTWSRVFSAMMRHLWSWWRGETFDKESGLRHLSHAACCLMFLSTYEQRKQIGFDDRPLDKDDNTTY